MMYFVDLLVTVKPRMNPNWSCYMTFFNELMDFIILFANTLLRILASVLFQEI